MKVILHQIGPFPHLELKILDTGLICLSGASGTGKSSLLRAITWIITGEPKREIINLYAKTKEKVWGSIEYKTLKIHRQKRPDKLQVITVKSRSGKELILEDDAAQHYLNNTFGVNSVIFASSYLAQKSAHPLLDLGITDRLDLIQNLVWSMDNPNVYIDRVEEKIKNISLEIKILSPEFEKEYKAWKKRKRACNVQNFTEPGPIRSQISEAETQITTLESQVAKLNKIRGKLENTRDQLRKIHIGEYPPISQLESTRESLKAELVLCTKIK